jgi:hypothetical protein
MVVNVSTGNAMRQFEKFPSVPCNTPLTALNVEYLHTGSGPLITV